MVDIPSPVPGPLAGPLGKKTDHIDRDAPDVEPSRAALVTKWASDVRSARQHWDKSFKRMRKAQDFAWGRQWSVDDEDNRYVANFTLRHVQQRTSTLYARNPKITSTLRERIYNTVWDGTHAQYEQALAVLTQGPVMGMPPDPQAQTIVQDYQKVKQTKELLRRIAKTLEILYQYNIDEQTVISFKAGMKMMVRRAVTTGIGYVKLDFQRIMKMAPEVQTEIADYTQQIHTLERLSQDRADDRFDDTSPKMEQLRLVLAELQNREQIVVREGLTWSYPGSTSIIPDKACKQLRNFLGCNWVAEEFLLSPDEIQEIYGVDVKSRYNHYTDDTTSRQFDPSDNARRDEANANDDPKARVYQIYCRTDGLVYTICDGWPDFLREPASPETVLERFWPWFALVLNEADHPKEIFPPGEVQLIEPMQTETNRARQGLREHRKANRPKMVTGAGQLDDEDIQKLKDHPANALLELNALQPGQSVEQLLQPMKMPPIDPNLYEVNQSFVDYQRTVGMQPANLGGLDNSATATQTNVAQSSQEASTSSTVDELDELLGSMAREGGHILLKEVSPQTAKKIVGEGAVWPELTAQEVAEDIYLGVKAGSSGKPNQAQKLQQWGTMMPFLVQMPGIDPEWLARETLSRADDDLDLTGAFKQELPSITAMNAAASRAGGGPGAAPGGGPPGPTAPGAGPVPGAGGAGQGGPANAPLPPGVGAAPHGGSQAHINAQLAGQVGPAAAGGMIHP